MSKLKLKVGDRIEILSDYAFFASVRAGDIGTIVGFHTTSPDNEYCYAVHMDNMRTTGSLSMKGKDCWYFRDQDLVQLIPAHSPKRPVAVRGIKPRSVNDSKLIRRALKAGLSIRQVARALNLSKSAVGRAAQKAA